MHEFNEIIKLSDDLASVLKAEQYEEIYSYPPLIGSVFNNIANFSIDYECFHEKQIPKSELEEYKQEIIIVIDKAKDKIDTDISKGKYTGERIGNYQVMSEILAKIKYSINNSLDYGADEVEAEEDLDLLRTKSSVTFTQSRSASEVDGDSDEGASVKASPPRPTSS